MKHKKSDSGLKLLFQMHPVKYEKGDEIFFSEFGVITERFYYLEPFKRSNVNRV
jgi:hypothetical protein